MMDLRMQLTKEKIPGSEQSEPLSASISAVCSPLKIYQGGGSFLNWGLSSLVNLVIASYYVM